MIPKWIGAHANNFEKGRRGKSVNKIILHWIVGTLESADATFAKADRLASAHYGIGDADIHQYVHESDAAYHAGNLTVNLESIGIEHEGGPDLPISEATIQTSINLVADICQRYNILADKDHIKRHSDIKATQCPGTLPVERIIAEVAIKITPPVIVNPDQTVVNLGQELGVMEVGAIRSTILDLRRDIKNEQDKLKGFVQKWVEEWHLNSTSTLVDVETEMAKLLVLEDRLQEYRDSIEGCVGTFPSDIALLEAHGAVKKQIEMLVAERDSLQQKLEDARIPAGYKFLKSWSLRSLLFKLYKRD